MADKLTRPRIANRSGVLTGVRGAINGRLTTLINFLGDFSTIVVVCVLFLFFGLTSERFFLTDNIFNIMKQMSIVGVAATGMTMVVLIGGIDLSVGSVALLSSAITSTLIVNYGWNTWGAIGVGLLASCLVGLVNGFFVEKLLISPVIVTLGTLIAVRGLGQKVLWINNSWIEVKDPIFDYVAIEKLGFLPVITVLMFGLYLLAAVLLKQTPFGRYIYAIGGNQRAAFLSGLPVTRIKMTVYVLCALTAGIAGLLTVSRTGVVNPTLGQGLEFDAVTAVVLGGTSLAGGVGRVEKTLLGTAILVMVLNYLTIRGVPGEWQAAVTGFLVLAAVMLDHIVRKRSTQGI
jgi:ribose transport system permease protein